MTKTAQKIVNQIRRRTEARAAEQTADMLRLGRDIDRGLRAEAEITARHMIQHGPDAAKRMARARDRVRAAVRASVLAAPFAQPTEVAS